jgi:hypothetical protein
MCACVVQYVCLCVLRFDARRCASKLTELLITALAVATPAGVAVAAESVYGVSQWNLRDRTMQRKSNVHLQYRYVGDCCDRKEIVALRVCNFLHALENISSTNMRFVMPQKIA